jgi:hypothetical protein
MIVSYDRSHESTPASPRGYNGNRISINSNQGFGSTKPFAR